MNLSFDAFSAALQQPAASKERFIFFSEARRSLRKGNISGYR